MDAQKYRLFLLGKGKNGAISFFYLFYTLFFMFGGVFHVNEINGIFAT